MVDTECNKQLLAAG